MSTYGKTHVFFFQFRFQKVIFFLIRLFLMAEHMCTLPSPAWNSRTAESTAIMWPTKRSSKEIYSAHRYLLAIYQWLDRARISQWFLFLADCAEILVSYSICVFISSSVLVGRSWCQLLVNQILLKLYKYLPWILTVYILTVSTISLNMKHLRLRVATDLREVVRLDFRPNSTSIHIICPQEYFRVLSEIIHWILLSGTVPGCLLCFRVYSR